MAAARAERRVRRLAVQMAAKKDSLRDERMELAKDYS